MEKKKTMKQKRLNGIDAAKGLAIMMVVLGHCADKNGPDRVLLHFSMFTGVGVFFLLSGATFCWRDGAFPWFDQRNFRSLTKSLWEHQCCDLRPFGEICRGGAVLRPAPF